jgi:hypothetical protein
MLLFENGLSPEKASSFSKPLSNPEQMDTLVFPGTAVHHPTTAPS